MVNDIALLELAEELDLMDYTPICLASAEANEAGKTAIAYGWGATAATNCQSPPTPSNVLQETELTVGCTEAQASSIGGVDADGQLCAVGASSQIYRVIIKPNIAYTG